MALTIDCPCCPVLSCVAGIELEPPQYPEVNDDPATRRGFDRLRTHGFTIQEVAAIRSYFSSHVQMYANRQPQREGAYRFPWVCRLRRWWGQ